ncbi:MAG: HAD-IC family P-type ATPase [Bacteroidetes bacterium]|nr:HAD-IC family P-type ATPase [Bacteroidota bacterium]
MKPATRHITAKSSDVCEYCGQTCGDDTVLRDGHKYCCFGCATLDQIMVDGKLRLNEVPVAFRQYDLPEIFDKAVEMQTATIYKIRVHAPAIHCSSCIELLEDLPEIDNRVRLCRVNFEDRSVEVIASKEILLSELVYLMDQLGYPPHFDLKGNQRSGEIKEQRALIKRLAVTGFCFGNSMLFSLPHYMGLQLANDLFFANLFKVLNLALSLIVLIYGAQPYFSSAFKAISVRKSHINIPIAIGAIAIWVWSVYEIISGTGFGYFDSLAGLIFFLLAGKWFQSRVYRKVSFDRSLHDLLPMTVRIRKNNGLENEWKSIRDLEVGDIISVKHGEVIPVTGELVGGHARIDYSFVTGESIPQRVNEGEKIYIGGKQTGGDITLKITVKPDPDSVWSAWKTPKNEEENIHWTHIVSRYFTPAILLIAVVAAAIWLWIDAGKALFVFSSVLIVACPCALALSAPFTYGSIQRYFSKNGLYLKASELIGKIPRINHLVFDKTGTLTENGSAEVTELWNHLDDEETRVLKSLSVAGNHIVGNWMNDYLQNTTLTNLDKVEIHPGLGVEASVNGESFRIGSANYLKIPKPVNGTHLLVEVNGGVKAAFSFANKYRKGLTTLLNSLGRHYKISVLSGDNDGERSALMDQFGGFAHLSFNNKPEDKKNFMNQLHDAGDSVLMIGDGLNDQVALATSDLGFVVTDNMSGFYPNADGVLMSDQFEKLPLLMELAAYSQKVLRTSLIFSVMYNLLGISFAVTGHLNPLIAAVLMPLSSITVVGLVTALVSRKAKQLQLK